MTSAHELLSTWTDALALPAVGVFDTLLASLLDTLREGVGAAAYGLIVLALVLGACGVPVPEEAVFAIGGALAASGRASVVAVYLLGWTTVLVLDLVLHGLGARFGPAIEHSRIGLFQPLLWLLGRGFDVIRPHQGAAANYDCQGNDAK